VQNKDNLHQQFGAAMLPVCSFHIFSIFAQTFMQQRLLDDTATGYQASCKEK
jgi:hypothetical protein